MKRVAKRSYTEHYRQEAVRLAGEVSVAEAGRRLEISAKTLANWTRVSRAGRMLASDKRALVTETEAELARLRAENARLRMEREILEEAAAYFAKESL